MNNSQSFVAQPYQNGSRLLTAFTIVAALIVAITPVIGALAARSIVGLTIATTIVLLVSANKNLLSVSNWPWFLSLALALLVFRSFLSSTWYKIPEKSLALFLLLYWGAKTSVAIPRRALHLPAYGVIAASSLLIIDALFNFPIYRSLEALGWVEPFSSQSEARGFAILAVIAPCITVGLFLQRSLLLAFLVVCAVTIALFVGSMQAALLAAMVASVAMICVWFAPRVTLICSAVALAVAILGCPLILSMIFGDMNIATTNRWPSELPFTWQHRLVIWQFTIEQIMSHPFLGHGTDAARWIGKTSLTEFSKPSFRFAMPLHPHNGPLQIWMELGAIGALIATAVTMFCLAAIWKMSHLQRLAAFGSFTAFTTMAMMSFGIWQTWWMTLAIFASSLVILYFKPSIAKPNSI